MALSPKKSKVMVIRPAFNVVVEQPPVDTIPTSVCVHRRELARQHTLGKLVRVAYEKNSIMSDAQTKGKAALRAVVGQRRLWLSLRKTFFAPNVDTDLLSESPALLPAELASYPCHCHAKRTATPLPVMKLVSVPSLTPRSPRTNSPLTSQNTTPRHVRSSRAARRLDIDGTVLQSSRV
jgi:hypothetical protein